MYGIEVTDSLQTGWMVKDEWVHDGFFGMTVEGRQRIGKSSFCCQTMAEAYGEWRYFKQSGVQCATCEKPDYRAVKKWIVFPPDEFLDTIMEVGVGTKEMVLLWDDAGFWLFVLDWYEPFVKIVARYLQLAGRQFGVVQFTSPSQRLISSKVLQALPELYVCRIIKRTRDYPKRKLRRAKIYQSWSYPDGKKGGVKTRWVDDFDAMLPDDFWEWYKPKSDHYLDLGMKLLKKEVIILKRKLAKSEKEQFMEEVYKTSGATPERLSEVDEVLRDLEKEMPQTKPLSA